MKIARYIGDLLYDYECVVIPGLGGFLTSETPATINPVTHHFKPPFKKIFFNTQLRANDGLLINYVAKEMGLSYREAKSQVDKFVLLCHDALKNGKRINFHRIGYIYMNSKEQIVFEQDTTINYDADAYGLTGFVSPAVRRVSHEEKLKEKVAAKAGATKPERKHTPKPAAKPDENKKKKQPVNKKTHSSHHMQAEVKRSPFKTQLAFVTLILLAMLLGIAIMNKETVKVYYDKYASRIPFFYRSPYNYAIDNLVKVNFTGFATSPQGVRLAQWLDNIDKSVTPEKTEVAMETESPAEPALSSEPEKADNNLTRDRQTANNTTPQEEATPKAEDNIQQASLIDNILPKEEPETVENTAPEPEAETEAEPVVNEEPEPVNEPVVNNVKNEKGYYIIAGSFKNVNNARKLVNKLRSFGYNALIADTNKYGMYRVAYEKFSDMAEAEQRLVAIRKEENHAAWIMRK